jgi:Tannase and feruloyl esterase
VIGLVVASRCASIKNERPSGMAAYESRAPDGSSAIDVRNSRRGSPKESTSETVAAIKDRSGARKNSSCWCPRHCGWAPPPLDARRGGSNSGPAFAITQFNFDRDPARMDAFSSIYDTYRDATLAEFRKRGGKLLIFHGTADPIFSALESIDDYQRLTRNNGGAEATSRWARLFLVPGMNHCAGGPATDSFDGLAAIVEWVEKGAAPSRIDASARPGTMYFPGRTRPLCAYPSYPRYTGIGSLEDAANFVCVAK